MVHSRAVPTPEALQSAVRRLQAYLDCASSGIFVYDRSGAFVDVNETACRMHGVSRDEMLSTDPRELIHPDSLHVFEAFRRTVTAGETFRGEAVGLRSDGSHFDAEVEGCLIEVDGDQYFFSSIIDVTERNRLAAQLRYSQRLEVTGQLAGGIAHEFNNLLMVIIGSAEIVQRGERDPALAEEVRSLLAAGEQARRVVEHLLAFSHQQVLKIEDVDLCALVEKQIELIRRLFPSTIDLSFRSQCSHCLVRADSAQLQDVLLSLCVNARQAMAAGGSIELVIGERTISSPTETAAGLAHGAYCLLEVCDSGKGMDSVTLARAFEPFFTTKDTQGASGLGLSMVHGSIRQHGGDVSIASAPGEGTTVRILLPFSQTATRPVAQAPSGDVTIAGVRVLVVEDNTGVRALVQRMLEGLGYTVVTAASVQEAAKAAQETTPDAAVLDMVLPDGSGVDVLAGLRERQPALPAVFMTGYVEGDTLGLADGLTDVPLLRKPFQIDTLAGALERVLIVA